jgi:DNA-binding MarR family transcriptional regulator
MAEGVEGLEAFDPLRLDHQLCFPLYAATNLLQRIYRPLLEPLGLTYSQYLVMLVLWERGQANVGDLRRCLHLDTGTLTPLLKRMEKAGFVTRRRDPEDERRVVIALTPHGAALRERAEGIPAALSQGLALPLDDSTRLYELTTAMVARLAQALPKLAA